MKAVDVDEVLKILYRYSESIFVTDYTKYREMQDKIANLPKVTDNADAVLDKIKDEIEQITDTMGVSYNKYVSLIDVMQILNKYKEESEDTEKLKPCINYEEDCEVWAGCPCIRYKAESEVEE